MSLLFKPSAAVFSIFLGLSLLDTIVPQPGYVAPKQVTNQTLATPKIQVAILLDVSGSMNGLIDQAKAQLWNMVSVMGKAKCETGAPQIEIALYEYGRTSNDPTLGYIKQITPFTTDLDLLSQELFKLKTDGGQEYCGHVIHTSLDELKWDTASSNYKVIFIAGNEDFLQGTVSYTVACKKAQQKGVIVNTIYCGSKERGIREHWNLAGECGNGSFTVIDHNSRVEDIPTPYDSILFVLNTKLNNTYIGYGHAGEALAARQRTTDASNAAFEKSSMAKRVAVKGNSQLYNNANWDLLDATKADTAFITKVDMNTLPDTLKTKTREQVRQIVEAKRTERLLIQKEIANASTEREKYIATEKEKKVTNVATLETEVERIIKEQAKRFNMMIQ